MSIDITKCPRLFVPDNLLNADNVPLSRDHAHYLTNVMRKGDGETVRVFNGREGEFIAKLAVLNKKTVELKWIEQIKPQVNTSREIHLYCSPIKKERFAMMIEKAVELGVTHIQPIVTKRTQNAKINIEKCERHMIEAAEQCERMDIPSIAKPILIDQCKFVAPSYAAIERDENVSLFNPQKSDSAGIIIGPEGGWDEAEITILKNHVNITAVSLGDNILRAETAAIFMLSRMA